jgi:hypothetical protein
MKIKELFEISSNDVDWKWLQGKIKAGKIKPVGKTIGIIDHDGYVSRCDRVDLSKLSSLWKKPLPVQFSFVRVYEVKLCKNLTSLSQLRCKEARVVDITETEITDFEGCPEGVAEMRAGYCNIITLKGLPDTVQQLSLFKCKTLPEIDILLPNLRRLSMPLSGLTNLKDIHKKCPKLEFIQLNASANIKSNILGLMKIPSLKMMVYSNLSDRKPGTYNTDYENALSFIEDGIKHNKNILDVQEEMIEAGLKDYAKL